MKRRLDLHLVALGLAESRERAQRLIRAGLVFSGERRLEKPGVEVPEDLPVRVRAAECPYVSRGGLKLEGALAAFAIDPTARVCLDLGASTGGFTDCLLGRGARIVYAIDVGRAQLHDRLRRDPRVVSREKTHIDDIRAGDFPELPSLVVADLSFISATRALRPTRLVASPGADFLLLVKPQFEVGRDRIPRGGVVRDPADQAAAVRSVCDSARSEGYTVAGETPSPIEGGDGNREWFVWLKAPGGE